MQGPEDRRRRRVARQLLLAALATSLIAGPTATQAQVLDADCFSGDCGGAKGVPRCPAGHQEVGWVLYANSKANEEQDCETVVSCTNLGNRPVEINCRFYHGFNPIRPGGPGEALCAAITPDVFPGDTTECATDATAAPAFQAGGIFLAGDADCDPFEGKGLVCARGGSGRHILCEAHLVCGGGTVLENIEVVRHRGPKPEPNDD